MALYDIDPVRLEESEIILSAINRNVNESRAVVKKYLGVENRKDALRGADFVVNAIQVGLSGVFSAQQPDDRSDTCRHESQLSLHKAS